MGGAYLEVSEFQVNNLHLPTSVINEYEQLTARQVETQQAEQQALTAKELEATLKNNPQYLELRKTQAFEKAVEKGQVEFWVLPQDMTMNAPPMIASLGMLLIVALVAAALVVGITLLQQERRSMRGVDPDYIESLRQENRRLANLLEEYLLENKAISLNDQDLLERTVELSHHRKRELGR